MDTKPPPDWSNLPINLINLIGNSLNSSRSRNDVARFRAVCKTFRSSVPPPPKIRSSYSHLKLPMPTELQRYGSHIFLCVSTIYAIEPCLDDTCRKMTKEEKETTMKIWVVNVEETKSGKFQVRDLFNKFASLKQMSQSLNLLDYQVTEITKQYRLQFSDSDDPDPNGRVLNSLFTRVVASESLDEIDPDFTVVMAIHNGRLCAWRNGDDKWTDILLDDNVTDVAFHGKRFYALSEFGHTVSVDPKSLKVTPVFGRTRYCSWLAKSVDDLLLIDSLGFGGENREYVDVDFRFRNREFDHLYLAVYKLDGEGEHKGVIHINSEHEEWRNQISVREIILNRRHKLSRLGPAYQNAPRMLFIGEDNNRLDITRNCLYFTKEDMDSYIVNRNGYDFGILDIEKRIFQSTVPDNYDIFWPPPPPPPPSSAAAATFRDHLPPPPPPPPPPLPYPHQ